MAIKPLPRLILIAAAVAGGWYGINRYAQRPHVMSASAVPSQADVPVAGTSSAGDAAPALVASSLAPATGGYTARTLLAVTLLACAYCV